MSGAGHGVVAVAVALVAACACAQAGLDDPFELPELNIHYYRCRVEPVLVKRCAFVACHGTDERPLRLYAPHRMRQDGSRAGSSLTPVETEANYDAARGFAGYEETITLLLTKGLDVANGGAYHEGATLYGGGDVFTQLDEPGYQTIAAWLNDSGQASSDCSPSQELGP